MRRIVTAVERNGTNVRILTLAFDVLDRNFNLRRAIGMACTAYCKTPEGRAAYEANCQEFNWADFAAKVPNEICQQFGFRRIDDSIDVIEVDLNEHLVCDDELEPDEDQ